MSFISNWFLTMDFYRYRLDCFQALCCFLVVIGVRVAFAAATCGFLGLVWIFSIKLGFEKGVLVAMKMAGTIPHSKVTTLSLSLIPTFILIGYLAYHAGLTKALFSAAKRWVGWLPGGLGVATVFSTAGFAAVLWCIRGDSRRICQNCHSRDVKSRLSKKFCSRSSCSRWHTSIIDSALCYFGHLRHYC